MKPRRIVLLGSDGFIGTHLGTALRGRFPDREHIGLSVADFDLSKTAEPLARHLDAATAVVMTAGVKRQWGDTLDAFSQNVAMAVNVARVLEKRPVGRLIFFSSAAVYGEENHDVAITEDTPIRPTSLYGAAKFASECVLRKALPLGFVALRPPLIYGPGDTSRSYGPAAFLHAAAAGETAALWGEGDEKREFVFVLDAVELVVRLVDHEFTGALNVATGRPRTFREAADLAGAAVATRPRTKPKVDHGFRTDLLRRLFPDFRFRALEDVLRKTAA